MDRDGALVRRYRTPEGDPVIERCPCPCHVCLTFFAADCERCSGTGYVEEVSAAEADFYHAAADPETEDNP